MNKLLWTIYIGFLAAGLRRLLKELHDRLLIRWIIESYRNGYSSVMAALAFTVTYSHMRNGIMVHSIAHIARNRVREFRYKGEMHGRYLIQMVENEMHLRTRVDRGKILSYDVVMVNINAVYLCNDESNIPKDVIAEVDRIEDIFMSLPRTIK